MILAEVVHPGAGFGADVKTLNPASVASYATAAAKDSVVAHILAIIPNCYLGTIVGGDLLQTLLVAILTGL